MFTFPARKNAGSSLVKIDRFECGACPECLQKKSRLWALRCSMEALNNVGMMVTLTYDTYKYQTLGKFDTGKSIEENDINPNLELNKRHCQLFMKRLRKHFPDKKIKYLISAERGKKGRAHYHALIFGVVFDDLIKYKKSSRGNIIYKSNTLEKIWKLGICTVDSVNPSAQIARYCTKYCAKDAGAEETFMLFSRGIGEEMLLKKFNGKSYWVDGREYSIPRLIWNKVIEKRYKIQGWSKYVNKPHVYEVQKKLYNNIQKVEKKKDNAKKLIEEYNIQLTHKVVELYNFIDEKHRKFRKRSTMIAFYQKISYYKEQIKNLRLKIRKLKNTPFKALEGRYVEQARYSFVLLEKKYKQAQKLREKFQLVRDNDSLYKEYIKYWNNKLKQYDFNRPSEVDRILALPDNKYWSYKQKALKCKSKQTDKSKKIYPFVPPRSRCSAFDPFAIKCKPQEKSFAPLSRHYRANDTKTKRVKEFMRLCWEKEWNSMKINQVDERDFINPFAR